MIGEETTFPLSMCVCFCPHQVNFLTDLVLSLFKMVLNLTRFLCLDKVVLAYAGEPQFEQQIDSKFHYRL